MRKLYYGIIFGIVLTLTGCGGATDKAINNYTKVPANSGPLVISNITPSTFVFSSGTGTDVLIVSATIRGLSGGFSVYTSITHPLADATLPPEVVPNPFGYQNVIYVWTLEYWKTDFKTGQSGTVTVFAVQSNPARTSNTIAIPWSVR